MRISDWATVQDIWLCVLLFAAANSVGAERHELIQAVVKYGGQSNGELAS
jgi:hypothetical protein